MLDKTNY